MWKRKPNLHEQWVGGAHLQPFAGCNFRMNELSGGVLLAQLRKLDRIVGDVRRNAQFVYSGIRDLPGIRSSSTAPTRRSSSATGAR